MLSPLNQHSRKRKRAIRYVCDLLESRLFLNAPGANWKLAFDDEFNGASLDSSKWSLYLPWSNGISGDNRFHDAGGNYLSYMMPDDVSFPGDGTVKLTTQKRDVTSTNGHLFNYTEAMLTTAGKFTAAYGYYEIRAKLPTGTGNWPAFWMTNGWPPEDDIMEYWPGQPREHQGLYGMDQAWHDYNDTTSGGYPSTNWHTWAMEWGPGYQKFFVDTTLTLTLSDPNGTFVPGTGNPQYLLLNSGVQNGQTAGYSNANNNALMVDYVRVYKYTSSAGPAVANPGFNTAGSFTITGDAGIVTGGTIGRTGTGDIHVGDAHAAGEVAQTITGLSPFTTYTFSAYGQFASGASEPGAIGVRNFAGPGSDTSVQIGAAAWTLGSVTFKTDAGTSATIYCKNLNNGNVFFDDLSLTRSPVAAVTTFAAPPNTTVSVPISQGSYGTFWNLSSAVSSDQTIVTNGNISLNAGKTALQITTGANIGTTTITMTAASSDFVSGPVVSTFVLTVLPSLSVSADANANTIRVVRNGSLLDLFIDNATSTPTSEYNYADYSQLTISGLNSNDSLILDYTGGDPVPAGGISFDGGVGTDSISFIGLPANNTATLASGTSVQIAYGSTIDTISYSNLENLSLNQGSGSNTLLSTSPTTNPTITLGVDAGSTLTLGADAALPTGTIASVAAGGTFSLANQDQSIDQLTGGGNVSMGAGDLTIGARNGSSTFSGQISGSGSITKIGTGTFTLAGSNTFTGAINIGTGSTSGGNVSGILRITKSTAVGSGSKSISLKDNNGAWGLLQLDGSGGNIALPSSISFNFNANTSSNNIIENLAGNNTIAGAITFNVGGAGYGILSTAGNLSFVGNQALTHVLIFRGGGNGSFSGTLSGAGSLTFSGGTWTLSGSNTYTGQTSVTSGQLTLAHSAALGATSALPVSSGAAVALQGGITIPAGKTFTLNGIGLNGLGALVSITGNNVWTSSLTIAGTGARINVSSGQVTLSNPLGGGSFTKVGAGLLLLNGANTFSTATTVGNGILELASGSLASNSISVDPGATLTVDAGASLSSSSVIDNRGTVNLKNASQTIESILNQTTLNLIPCNLTMQGGSFYGPVTGSGGLNVIGSGGMLILAEANSFSGGTSLSAGQLFLTHEDGLAGGALSLSNLAYANFASVFSRAVVLSSLSISGSSYLNTGGNKLIVNKTNTPAATIAGWIASGFAGGAWNGPGIRSSQAQFNAPHPTGVGMAEATELFSTFPADFGNRQVGANAVLLRTTPLADANLDGAVNSVDFTPLAANFNAAGSTWARGDYNYDGVANGLDFNALATNFAAAPSAPTSAPSAQVAATASSAKPFSLFSEDSIDNPPLSELL